VPDFFPDMGERYEFRMRKGVPIGAIVKLMGAVSGLQEREPKDAVLVVTRLTPTPCVIAVVKFGPSQKKKAQRLADASAGKPCRKSSS
jgi:hypothetical protein